MPNDTMVTVTGNVATAVEYRDTATGGLAKFRFAATARRYDREKALWTDGPTSFYTVIAWRHLGANLAASVSVGDPLVVHGRLRVREEEWEGKRRTFVDIDATAAGHDLTRGTSAFRRVRAHERTGEARTEDAPAGAGDAWSADRAPDGDPWAAAPPPEPERGAGPDAEPAPQPAPDARGRGAARVAGGQAGDGAPPGRGRQRTAAPATARRRHAEPVS
ncbi:single-stranded DNA-binding protein [Streptomyces solincola]|uniref:Single-stranded DNA-binding protein n=1 Tax=Streptomyces solincola TaxID=2100817 RepID=A0A2S9PV44_9ACTN|nr:single-stranded DNA-binding protein [Streptomyces solincola]PRH78278.1 single-stranded DNA-binding protein [Streptomyces solincola]